MEWAQTERSHWNTNTERDFALQSRRLKKWVAIVTFKFNFAFRTPHLLVSMSVAFLFPLDLGSAVSAVTSFAPRLPIFFFAANDWKSSSAVPAEMRLAGETLASVESVVAGTCASFKMRIVSAFSV